MLKQFEVIQKKYFLNLFLLIRNKLFLIFHIRAVKTLSGTLNIWAESGFEGKITMVVGLNDLEALKNPDGSSFAGGHIYFMRGTEKFSIYDNFGREIWKNGNYIIKETLNKPADESRKFFIRPKGVEESDWTYWCCNHYKIKIYFS